MLSEIALAARETFRAENKAAAANPATLQERRDGWNTRSLENPVADGTQISALTIAGRGAEWLTMDGGNGPGAVLYLHGGGYVNGSPITHRKLGSFVGAACGMPVLLPDYRLAPEHPFPAGLDDCIAAYRWLLEQGHDPRDLVVGGDSAGGGMAAALLLALRRDGLPQPRCAILQSPWVDLTMSHESYEANRQADPQITREGLDESAGHYANGADRRNEPLLSPAFADLTGLAPMLIHAGGIEVMLGDSLLLAERAEACGVPVSLEIWEGCWHVHHHWVTGVPEAQDAVAAIGRYVRSRGALLKR